jgi:hypothetical protein
VRATWFLVLLAACHPSATVEHTMPVANLQSYRTVALRVRSTAFASQGQATWLEQATINHLRQKCAFEVVPVGQQPADVVLDLNITRTGRGGGGLISNENTAVLDALLVLTDGQDGQLLGTATIHGKSSGMIINNQPPENEAIDVVGKTVADVLFKSGCGGPRVARAATPPPPTGTGSDATTAGAGSGAGAGSSSGTAPPDDAKRAQAEQLNEQGKEKLYGADIAGALALFQQANALVPDARYQFNVCIAFGAQEQWDNAIAACQQARGMNPDAKLSAKIDHRIDLLQHRQ